MSLASQPSLQNSQTSSQSIPRLAEPFEPTSTGDTTPRTMADVEESFDSNKKKNKRGLFGFGKKKPEDIKEAALKSAPSKTGASTNSSAVGAVPTRRSTASPTRAGEQSITMTPSSPGRNLTSSPHLSSPAGSQIFERDVQESAVLMPNSPAIPSHIVTENYIPPALDASSEAITDDHLDPDSVEIITHSSHQPASVTVTGVGISSPHPFGGSDSGANLAASWADELASFAERDNLGLRGTDGASNYGSFDTTDVRRLSFISFADVVQAEHAGAYGPAPNSSRDSMHLAGLTSLASMGQLNMANRSPSPIRSPVSSAGGGPGTSPPTSKSGSVKGLELSPSRNPNKSLASPTSPTYPLAPSEIAVETMSQALRRTGSTDLSGVRSVPTSPVEGPSR